MARVTLELEGQSLNLLVASPERLAEAEHLGVTAGDSEDHSRVA